MARSPQDDPRFSDSAWQYHGDTGENHSLPDINHTISSTTNVLNESLYTSPNFGPDVYKNQYNVQAPDIAPNKEENIPFNTMPNVNRYQRQNYGNAMLNLGNGQLVRVFYDENNQQLIFPMSGQYELFSNNQGLCDMPVQPTQPPHMFTLNQDFSRSHNAHAPTATIQNTVYNQDVNAAANQPTSNFLKEVLGNWEPNSSGTYSPFGQNYPLNHPEPPLTMIPNPQISELNAQLKQDQSPKRNENSPLADTSTKKRIVAEVKPMRPSYSDVLSKNTKNTNSELNKTKLQNNIDTKLNNKQQKLGKPGGKIQNNDKNRGEKKQTSTVSSGSDSGDINTDDNEKCQKPNKKSKNRRNNMSRKWSSLDDVTNEEEHSPNQENESQFVFIKTHEKPKKEKKIEKPKASETVDDIKQDEEESQFVLQDGQSDGKSKKKREPRGYHKPIKPVKDKKPPTQTKVRRNKPWYLGLAQSYLEHWGDATWKALVWLLYLLSDVCHMSLHLSFDLCTSVFTQSYVSCQAVWSRSKEWLSKLQDNKYLMYIDRKFGHTRFGFWRKLKWFKKEREMDSDNESNKLNSNIPLPSTGEEAMKRLLACQGKDPYSILGVSETCTDEEIKRYYRRQAFLVHPDKNQQPGAEEAFKILQHAFDLIGEPERREEYERKARESRHVEAAWSEFSELLAQLHRKMEFAANTIRCTNCGRRHKRVATDRPCYAARYCSQCKIRHSAKEGDIWAESSMWGLLVMYYACMDGAVYQITQWATCQKKNLKQLRADCHIVQYRIVLGNKAPAAHLASKTGPEPNLEEFLNNLYNKSGVMTNTATKQPPAETDVKKRRNKKAKA
ncbi:unnamed protein product [Pieris macdunnoughi]|uniref:J domain-containing protein n=1 Tax=Pieris macdunnoughi TaxID=345717 RepID=A0A821VD91_9NEOP|nr:unnamed protein product [Pieris macdunnoughi]